VLTGWRGECRGSETVVVPAAVAKNCQPIIVAIDESSSNAENSPLADKEALHIVLQVGESATVQLEQGKGVLFIKDLPNTQFVTVTNWKPLSDDQVALTLMGLAVGDTQMNISDKVSNQAQFLFIKVIPATIATTPTPTESSVESQALFVNLNVGESSTFAISGGQGKLSLVEMPNNAIATLTAWQARADGNADFTLTGLMVGTTRFVVFDEAMPPQKWIVTITVKKATASNASTGKTTTDEEDVDNSNNTTTCEEKTALEFGTNGLSESRACFIAKMSTPGILRTDTLQISNQAAKRVRLSVRVWVAPEHVGKTAEFIMVSSYLTPMGEINYTRDEKVWQFWDNRLTSLPIAQYHPQLPEIVDVFIFEGDLRSMLGDFWLWVGYRLEEGNIVYNGLNPINFAVIK
jgi:hypothetical protein